MSVQLDTLVKSLKRAVQPPGGDVFPDALPSDWVGQLADAFYNARLYGFFGDLKLSDDGLSLEPKPGGADPEPELVQLIVKYAALNVVRTQLTNILTATKYQAGPVLAETQRSAQLLKALFQQQLDDLEQLKDLLSSSGAASASAFDLINLRDRAMYDGVLQWVD